jgi:Putative prokaryotic signal transducing protein
VQIDPEDFKRHYALLSDDALLEINRGELVDAARPYYDAELAQRKLASPDAEENPSSPDRGDETPSQTEGGPQLVATFLSLEEANFARGLLQSADITCSLENEHGVQWAGNGALRMMVPASAYDRACEILEAEISEEDLIAQAEAGAAEKPDAPEDDKS